MERLSRKKEGPSPGKSRRPDINQINAGQQELLRSMSLDIKSRLARGEPVSAEEFLRVISKQED